MKIHKILLSAARFSALAACKKDKPEEGKLDPDASEDIGMTMNFDEEMNNIGQMSLEGKLSGKKSTSWLSCVTWGIDTTGPVTEITLDFGTTNCTGDDGRNRRGILIVTFEDNPFDAGSVVNVTSNGFAINDHEINGTKAITFKGFNADNDPYNEVNTAITIEKPNGKIITWNSVQERVWTDGFGNADPFDNAVEVTGTANGTTANGVTYAIEIITPLRVVATCSNIVSGSFELTGATFADRLFDYGNGDCDRKATVTVNGNTYNFLL